MAKRQYNTWQEREDCVIEINLTQGKVALIDKTDLEKVLPWKWCAHFECGRWYAYSSVTVGPYKSKLLRMHRIILEPPDGMEVDHVNHDGLDNRRYNIRIATRSQNLANRDRPVGRNYRYKGIYCIRNRPLRKPWTARLSKEKLGYFATEIEAAHAYNQAARERFGEFAVLNPI